MAKPMARNREVDRGWGEQVAGLVVPDGLDPRLPVDFVALLNREPDEDDPIPGGFPVERDR